MAKRSHTHLHSFIDTDDQPLRKSRSSAVRTLPPTDDIGEFEDAWEDEIEEEQSTNDPDGQPPTLFNN